MWIFRFVVVFLGISGFAMAEPGQIVVVGQAQVERVPDMATLTLGVTYQSENASDAVGEVAVSAGAILNTLGEIGIAAKDMRTSDLSLQPVWKHDNKGADGPRIVGYSASNRVTVTIRDLAVLGDILGRVTAQGANRFEGLQFGLQDRQPALNEARRLAVSDAQARAQLYAEAAGVTLGKVVRISEIGQNAPGPVMAREAFMMADAAMPVAEGELSLSASVTMVFEINP